MSKKRRGRRPRNTQSAIGREPQGRKAIAQAPQPTVTKQNDAAERSGSLTLEQRRAAFALVRVKAAAGKPFARDYRAYARNLPAVVLANGLGQAIALKLAQSARQDGDGHGLLLDHVTAWLVEADGWGASSPYLGKAKANASGQYRDTQLIEAIVSGSDGDFVRAQMEVMGFLKWVKTFAEALIEAREVEGASDVVRAQDAEASA